MKRRSFVQHTVAAGAASSVAAVTAAVSTALAASHSTAPGEAAESRAGTTPLPRMGPKPVVRGKKAVASSQHPIVTETMLQLLREGGTAVDAGIAHTLRWAEFECGYLWDPKMFEVPTDLWLSDEHHRYVAQLLKRSRPKVDLTEHVKVTSGKAAMVAAGLPVGVPDKPSYKGSCELSIVDEQGNWVQMMNTLQSGGIPGAVVGGVPMVGSHAQTDMRASIAGWFTGRGRQRLPIGNTIVLKDGKPWLSLGTPGNVHVTIPQVLSNILDFGMEPPEAADQPRMLALRDDYTLDIESRLPAEVVAGLARLGITLNPQPEWDYHMGSFHMSWRDPKTGLLCASADARRAGQAGGLV